MAEGLRIDYALRLLGIPFRWQSLISVWEPPRRFVDEQTKGPYRSWRHTHAFAAQDDGTLMTDEVEYELPLGPLGWLGLPLVKLQLGRIFRHREKAIQRLLLEAEAG
jgi:ligand-binding SRPBCC domain-containing protein